MHSNARYGAEGSATGKSILPSSTVRTFSHDLSGKQTLIRYAEADLPAYGLGFR